MIRRQPRSTLFPYTTLVRAWGAVTLTLIAANVAMFVVTAISAASIGAAPLHNSFSPVFFELSQLPVAVDAGPWWRLVTAALDPRSTPLNSTPALLSYAGLFC